MTPVAPGMSPLHRESRPLPQCPRLPPGPSSGPQSELAPEHAWGGVHSPWTNDSTAGRLPVKQGGGSGGEGAQGGDFRRGGQSLAAAPTGPLQAPHSSVRPPLLPYRAPPNPPPRSLHFPVPCPPLDLYLDPCRARLLQLGPHLLEHCL